MMSGGGQGGAAFELSVIVIGSVSQCLLEPFRGSSEVACPEHAISSSFQSSCLSALREIGPASTEQILNNAFRDVGRRRSCGCGRDDLHGTMWLAGLHDFGAHRWKGGSNENGFIPRNNRHDSKAEWVKRAGPERDQWNGWAEEIPVRHNINEETAPKWRATKTVKANWNAAF
jgi:hypothetical protein